MLCILTNNYYTAIEKSPLEITDGEAVDDQGTDGQALGHSEESATRHPSDNIFVKFPECRSAPTLG